jgi:DNA-binding CsgD family transcriptional regulator
MLYGREAEIARIEALIAAARDGQGGTLLLQADAGMGKTALLDAASRHATGMRQLKTAGLEAESSLPFSALAELTERLLDGISALPAPQAAAIEGALALGPPAPGDRFAVCTGFLGLLSHAAEREPMLVLVDDAQWLDPASAEALAFAGRRLASSAIAVLVAARIEEGSPFSGPGVERITLSPLEAAAARALLDEGDPELPSSVVESLLGAAAGNPLALIELPSLLTADQRAGKAGLDEPLQPGVSLQHAFDRRVEDLPADAREACLVAATAFTPRLGPILAACEALELDAAGLEQAETRGVVRLSGERIEFSHPLLRGAVYHGSPAASRRRAHEALATAVGDEHRGWHLAAAALGPDEGTAVALDHAGQHARSRGAHSGAAHAFERAAALSEERDARARRLLAAGVAATAGGEHGRALARLREATDADDPDLEGEAIHRLAMVSAWEAGDVLEAHRALVAEAGRVEATDPLHAATLLADAATTASSGGVATLALETAKRARELLGDDGDATQRAHVLAVFGWSLALRGESPAARSVVEEVDRLLPGVDPRSPAVQSIAFAINSRIPSEEYERAGRDSRAIVAAAREAGFLGTVPFPLAVAADTAYRVGEWDTAEEEVSEAVHLAEETGQRASLSFALVVLARLAAARGEEERARDAVSRALELAERASMMSITAGGIGSLAFLELGLGRVDQAIGALEELRRMADEAGFEEPTVIPWAPDLVEAYAQAGRDEDAQRMATRLHAQAEHSDGAVARAFAARCRGLTSPQNLDELFAEALELHDSRPVPFERARTLLAFGTRLHRARRRVDARRKLRAALETFEHLRAEPWAERTRAELRAAGAIKRDPVGDPDELTAQEVRVALAVARGATNRQVAAEMFLSPKTIEFHLGRVYRKLGIHSRTELAALAAQGRLEPGVAAEHATNGGRSGDRADA